MGLCCYVVCFGVWSTNKTNRNKPIAGSNTKCDTQRTLNNTEATQTTEQTQPTKNKNKTTQTENAQKTQQHVKAGEATNKTQTTSTHRALPWRRSGGLRVCCVLWGVGHEQNKHK